MTQRERLYREIRQVLVSALGPTMAADRISIVADSRVSTATTSSVQIVVGTTRQQASVAGHGLALERFSVVFRSTGHRAPGDRDTGDLIRESGGANSSVTTSWLSGPSLLSAEAAAQALVQSLLGGLAVAPCRLVGDFAVKDAVDVSGAGYYEVKAEFEVLWDRQWGSS